MPNAGPTLPSMLADGEDHVERRSGRARCGRRRARAPPAPTTKTADVDEDERRSRPSSACWSTTVPLRRTGATSSGCTVWSTSRPRILPSSRWRTTLIEPAVEPAAPADEEQRDERHQREQRPGVVVDDRVAGRRHRRDDRKMPAAHRRLAGQRHPRSRISATSDAPSAEQREVQAQLLVARAAARLRGARSRGSRSTKLIAADDHEHDDHPLRHVRRRPPSSAPRSRSRRWRSSSARARTPRRCPSRSSAPSQPGQQRARGSRRGEPDVEDAEAPHGVADAPGERVDLGPGSS